MKQQINADLLDKYLKGLCTSQEEVFINEWYESFENDFDHISSISDSQKQLLKTRIRSAIDQNTGGQSQVMISKAPAKLRTMVYALSGIAASLIILFLLFNNKPQKVVNNAEVLVVTNNTSTISEQILSDGSHVWLNPGAQLKFSKIFSGNKREVTMSGEAFFEVTKNPARPFIIYSGNLVTKVWGTSFRVRDAKYLPYADVAVVTGKVSVKLLHNGVLKTKNTIRNNSEEVMIYPDQKVTYTKTTDVFKESPKADIKELHIWKKINVVFDNRQVSDVLPVLNKEFDVNITTREDKVAGYLLSADFNGLNLPQVLELVHKTLNVSYEMSGREIILKSNQ